MNSALPNSTDEVKTYSEKFEEHELRKVLYDAAQQKRENGEIRDAIKIVLLGWNWRAYNDTDLSNDDLNRQVDEFIRTNRHLLHYFEDADHTLETVDFQKSLEGREIGEHVKSAFDTLLENKAMGPTGASKALHIASPSVLMMWDDSIIDAYHQEGEPAHRKRGNSQGEHTAGDARCYREFLKETQSFINSELAMRQFSGKSPAKVMDEYNYAKYMLDN